MTDKIVVLVTTGTLKEARKIARRLVEARLAACVNLCPPIRSIYRWQGKIADEREYLLLIKTKRCLFGELKDAILNCHSYTTPEILCLPVIKGSQDYLQWINASVKRGAEEE